jgi:hypothetical protein
MKTVVILLLVGAVFDGMYANEARAQDAAVKEAGDAQ